MAFVNPSVAHTIRNPDNSNHIFVDYGDREYFRKTSGVDEKVIRQFEGDRAAGSKEFVSTLKMECGGYRRKRGKPAIIAKCAN